MKMRAKLISLRIINNSLAYFKILDMKIYFTPDMPPLCWGYQAITLWPIGLFVRGISQLFNVVLMRHERIHWEQQKEMLGIFFYAWYIGEYLIRLALYLNHWNAYSGISFELEANYHEDDPNYLAERKPFHWLKYL